MCIRDREDPISVAIIDSYDHPITQIKAVCEDDAVKLYTL